jgi:hypothetical protein
MNNATERNGLSRPVPWGGQPFPWDTAKDQAALDLAEGRLTADEIATRAGVDRTTIWSWQKHADFAQRVREQKERLGTLAERVAVGSKLRRLEWLNDMRERLQRIVDQRAADPQMNDVPGGDSGYLVPRQKQIGSGANAQTVVEYVFDADLSKELRACLEAAARELDQLPRGGGVTVNNVHVPPTPPEPPSGKDLARRVLEIITGRPMDDFPDRPDDGRAIDVSDLPPLPGLPSPALPGPHERPAEVPQTPLNQDTPGHR